MIVKDFHGRKHGELQILLWVIRSWRSNIVFQVGVNVSAVDFIEIISKMLLYVLLGHA